MKHDDGTGATVLDITMETMHSHGYGSADVASVGSRDGSRKVPWDRFADDAARIPAVLRGLPDLYMTGLDPDLCLRFRDGGILLLETDTDEGRILQWWSYIPV